MTKFVIDSESSDDHIIGNISTLLMDLLENREDVDVIPVLKNALRDRGELGGWK